MSIRGSEIESQPGQTFTRDEQKRSDLIEARGSLVKDRIESCSSLTLTTENFRFPGQWMQDYLDIGTYLLLVHELCMIRLVRYLLNKYIRI